METVDVVLLYEHVARELDVLCAVKHLLAARHGLRAEIVQQPYGVAAALSRFRPQVVALPFCYQDSLTHYPFMLDWPKATYFNLAWEELFYEGNRAAKLPNGEFETQQVLHHAWGEFFAADLQQCGVPRAHIFLNGQPAYMLYADPYRQYFPTRLELAQRHGLDPERRWIFFPENYNWAFYADWKLDSLERSGLRRDHMDTMVRFCRDSLTAVLAWCAAVAAHQPVEIIIRPRPAVPLEDFATFARQAVPGAPAAVHITKAETVREWILASDVVVSSYSTSLIEAAVAGKATAIVEPFPIPPVLAADWQAHLPRLTTLAAFDHACLYSTPAAGQALNEWTRASLLAHGDAIVNLAQILADVRQSRVKRPALGRSSLLPPGRPRWRAWLQFEQMRRAGHSARRTAPASISPLYEADIVSEAEIKRRVQRWGQVLTPAPVGAASA